MSYQIREEKELVLTETEEQLLTRYFDNEASKVDSLRVHWLKLRKRLLIEQFLSSLGVIREIARGERVGVLKQNPEPVDLWSRIDQRINEEERLEVLYGRNHAQPAQREPRAGWLGAYVERFAWGLGGGVVAACATVVMLQGPAAPLQMVGLAQTGQQVENTDLIRPVRYSSPVAYSDEGPHVVEVDWMRSDGRVRLLHEPEDRSALIWVKKRAPFGSVLSRRGESITPLDVEPIQVINNRIPESIPVSNR